MSGKIFVITGTSGSGKTTLANAALEDSELNLAKVMTSTTREPRHGEVNGKDFNFFTRPEFEKLVEEGKFYEHAEVYGNYYGSLKEDVESLLESEKNVVFIIDVQGAETLEKMNSNVISIFVKTPSITELKKRLEKRGQDSKEVIEKRLETAEKEEKKAPLFDYIIVNNVLEYAIEELKSIIRASMLD